MTDTTSPPVNRGLLIALGAVGGLVALVALWAFVVSPLLADDGAVPLDAAAPAPADSGAAPGEVVEEETDGAEADAPLPETFEVFSARDPFQQLVTVPVAPTVSTTEGGTGTGTGDPAAPGTGTGGTGTGGTGGTDGGETGGEEEPPTGLPGARVGTTVVRLVEVTGGGTRATITVNGASFDVGEGDTFAGSFRALDISGSCATLLFGDSRFTLCTGDEIRK